MGRRKTELEPGVLEHILEQHSKGYSYREIEAELTELGVLISHMKVKRLVDESKASASAPHPPAPLASAPEDRQEAPPQAPKPKLTEALQARKDRQAGSADDRPPETPEDPGVPFDFEGSLQRMIRDAEREARQHDQASNPRGAQAAMRRASELMKVLAQSEKRKPADPDVLQFSLAEIDRAYAEISALLAKLCERPVLCSECSRALSVKFGRGKG